MRSASLPFFLLLTASCYGRVAEEAAGEPAAVDAGTTPVIVGSCPGQAICPVIRRGTATGPIRAAVVWQKGGLTPATSTIDHVVGPESEPVAPTFPAHFRIELPDRPPDDVIGAFTTDVTFQSAVGHVVVYEDLNGNGRLDLIPDGGEAQIDRILAAEGGIGLEFYDGKTEDIVASPYFQTSGLAQGYNLVDRGTLAVGPECVATPCEASSALRTIPRSSELVVTSDTPPMGLASTCARFQGLESSMGDIETPCPAALPDGVGRICVDATHQLVAMFETPFPPCRWGSDGRLRYCGIVLEPGQSPPEGWPCR